MILYIPFDHDIIIKLMNLDIGNIITIAHQVFCDAGRDGKPFPTEYFGSEEKIDFVDNTGFEAGAENPAASLDQEAGDAVLAQIIHQESKVDSPVG